MKLVIEYDPFCDRSNAMRAAAALKTLGLPAELREVRLTRGAAVSDEPVRFDTASGEAV